MNSARSSQASATGLGILGIIFWSSTIAFSRDLAEQLGALTSATCIYAIGGTASCLYFVVRPAALRQFLRLPRRYVFGCGGLFVAYTVCLYLAVGLSSSRQQVIEVGIINYLWPSLTLAFSVPVLGKRARPALLFGIFLAFGGIALTMTGGSLFSVLPERSFRSAALPYCLAAVAAVTWALYNNLVRRWGGETEAWALPPFFLATALALGLLRAAMPEVSAWSARSVAEVLYMAAFPTVLAYSFWDVAVRRGNILLVVTLSYFTPLLSTFLSALLLDAALGPWTWLGCVLVVAGALLCKSSFPAEIE